MSKLISHRNSAAAVLGALFVAGLAASPAYAQFSEMPFVSQERQDISYDTYVSSLPAVNIRSVSPSRLRGIERLEFEAMDREDARLRMDDDEIRADVSAQLVAAGASCSVTALKRVGTTPDAQSIYETACAEGPGYVLVNGVEPKATNCLALEGAAATARRRNPRASVGAQCTLSENQNGLQLITNWAREAGVTCRIDQAEWIGPNEVGSDVYEVGCDSSEGYWIEKASSGWTRTDCIELSSSGLTCRFTDQAEQFAWMRAKLVGTPAETCDVAGLRMIGTSRQGRHYETLCGAQNEGFVLRISAEGQAEDVTPCAEDDTCVLTRTGRSDG